MGRNAKGLLVQLVERTEDLPRRYGPISVVGRFLAEQLGVVAELLAPVRDHVRTAPPRPAVSRRR